MVTGTKQVKVASRVVEYLPGRGMDVYAGPGEARPVLLWHGRGPDERQVLRPLARLAAEMGLVVFVPDWRPDAADGGRAELLASVEFARSAAAEFARSGQELVLAGWSRGGKAAAVPEADGLAVEKSTSDLHCDG